MWPYMPTCLLFGASQNNSIAEQIEYLQMSPQNTHKPIILIYNPVPTPQARKVAGLSWLGVSKVD